jgi:Lon protease-like protein
VADPGGTELPIFELPLVLLPSEQVPLHIFEDRYKAMIERCLSEEEPFGIVFRDDSGARSRGCAAEVAEVVERFDDGRLNIVATGEWRFDVLERFEAEQYPAATVAAVPDADHETATDPGPALEAFATLLAAVGGEQEQELEGEETAYEIAAHVELPVAFKQELLEEDVEGRRLELLGERLAKLAIQVKRARELAERARGNGHGPIDGLRSSED